MTVFYKKPLIMKTCVLISLCICVALCAPPSSLAAPLPEAKPAALFKSLKTPPPPKKYRAAADGSLTQGDITLYKAIFHAQNKGQMAKAERLMWKLSDMRLRGHVLYQRYMHPTAYTSRFTELKSWLDLYADHPGADRIYALALRKGTDSQVQSLRKPTAMRKIVTRAEPTMVQRRPAHQAKPSKATQKFEDKISSLIRQGKDKTAVDAVFSADQKAGISKLAIDYYKAKIAENYLYKGETQIAYELAQPAFKRSGAQVPLAGWVCGLLSWYNQDFNHAAHYFAGAAESDYASGWMQAASSYWAARAYTRINEHRTAKQWLARAQDHPRTFYGLLATVSARQSFHFDWQEPHLTAEMRKTIAKTPAAFRALALLDVGQKDLAEQEIMHINTPDVKTRKALLTLTAHYNLPSVSIRLGSLLDRGENSFYDAALYPDISYSSNGLYQVDPALVHAIARQESRFDINAESRSGARGLMQIMPKTARYVADKHNLPYGGTQQLSDPDLNMTLGQYYISDLLKHPNVQDDIVAMMIAYNAGPGNLGKWKRQWDDVDDTLLFIELLPSRQTREYVERVLSNYWIYRMKQGRDVPTMEALARGQDATYTLAAQDLPFNVASSTR